MNRKNEMRLLEGAIATTFVVAIGLIVTVLITHHFR